MIPPYGNRVRDTNLSYAVAILILFLVIFISPIAQGQANQISQKPDRVSLLIRRLSDPKDKAREDAAIALGETKSSRAVLPLIAALKGDSDFWVRIYAAGALGKIGDPRASEPLIASMRDPNSGVQEKATDALAKIKDPRIVEPLIAALRNPESQIRPDAAEVLGKIKDSRAVGPLVAALKDADPRVRDAAARALGEIKGAGVVEPLISALNDTDPHVRDAAADALGTITDPRAADALRVFDSKEEAKAAEEQASIDAKNASRDAQRSRFENLTGLSPEGLDKSTVYWTVKSSPNGKPTLKDKIACYGGGVVLAEMMVPCGVVFVNQEGQIGGTVYPIP